MTLVMRRAPSHTESGWQSWPSSSTSSSLLKFREAINDAKSQLIPKLDLDHLTDKLLPHLSNLLGGKLQLPSTSLDEMIDKQGCEVLNLLVTGMLAQI